MVSLHWFCDILLPLDISLILSSTNSFNFRYGSNYLTAYDLSGRIENLFKKDSDYYISSIDDNTDKFFWYIIVFGLQICMISSALFHTFSCHSEKTHRSWQATDHFGIIWAMFGTYVPFLCQAFDCHFVSWIWYYCTKSYCDLKHFWEL